MRKIILYIASSLDGKIADKNGEVGWLDEIPNPDKSDYGYQEFYDSIDTTLMGNKTWQQVKGFGIGNPYKGKKNYVFTRKKSGTKDNEVEYVNENIIPFIKQLKTQQGKNIWCVGGSEFIAHMLNNNLIDEIRLFLMPVVLGEGIDLTGKLGQIIKLEMCETHTYHSGVVELRYKVKTPE